MEKVAWAGAFGAAPMKFAGKPNANDFHAKFENDVVELTFPKDGRIAKEFNMDGYLAENTMKLYGLKPRDGDTSGRHWEPIDPTKGPPESVG